MEPDEEKKLDLRREKQAARSSRTIYDLQQQVKNQVICYCYTVRELEPHTIQ